MKNKLILFSIGIFILSVFSSCKKDYLKKAIQYDAILCVRLYTPDCSDTIFVYKIVENLEKEILKDTAMEDINEYIYSHIKDSIPFCVSKEFYQENNIYPYIIQKDSLMQVIYDRYGVPGLLKNYFKIEGTNYPLYVFRNEQERFVVRNEKPRPAFGENQNLGYMCYLLSKHNMHMIFIDLEEILHITIDPDCSDEKAWEKYKEESQNIPLMRDPYED